jgi:hypothetical protein
MQNGQNEEMPAIAMGCANYRKMPADKMLRRRTKQPPTWLFE